MKKKLFDQSELVYLLLAIIGISVLVTLILVKPINEYISGLHPVYQFLLLNMGIYLIFFFFFKGIALRKKRMWKGVLGAILGYMAFDLILPEYHVGINGLVAGGIFGKSAVDYFLGFIYSSIGFSGILLAIMTYGVSFIALFVTGAILVKDFVRKT